MESPQASAFPIDSLRDQFIDSLEQQDLIVTAGTGSGKSTRLPVWASASGKTLVVEPRRVACTALAGFVAGQLNTEVGKRVGYAIRFEQKLAANTEIAFVTPGIALRWQSEGRLQEYRTIILDEFHERRWDMDLLLALLRHQGLHRLVITSATIDTERLQRWSGARVLDAETTGFPVEVRYSAALPGEMPDQKDIAANVAKAVIAQIERSIAGDLLVFLPGRREISDTAALLRKRGISVTELHGGIDNRQQQAALLQSATQRVILATNIAETSLTIPGVSQVIDAGLERRTHQRNGRTVLALHPISRASAEQRKGRAGRMGPGHCLRLWGEHAPLELVTPAEVVREELTDLVLAAACSGTPAASLDFPTDLPEKSLAAALEQLQTIAAIDADGKATEHGQRLFPLPIDTQFAHLITAMPDNTLRGAMIDLSAALTVNARLISLPRDELKRRSLTRWQPLACDALSLIKLLRTGAPEDISVAAEGLAEARKLAAQIRAALGLDGLPAEIDFQHDAFTSAILNAQPSLAFVRREKRPQAMGNGFSEVLISDHSRFDEEAVAALVLDQYSLPGRGTRQTINKANCLAPLSFGQLVAAGIGETVDSDPEYSSEGITVKRQRIYAGRSIATERVSPQGNALIEAIAKLILRGSLMSGVGRSLTVDIEAWALWCEVESLPDPVPEPHQWLCDQLTLLGVESLEDLELIDHQDLAFEGIPAWQRAEFDSRYPRTLSLGNLKLKVDYSWRQRLVTVEPVSGTRKQPPSRRELPVWKGWRIQYRKASRVVDIR